MENNTNILILAAGDIRNKFNYVRNNCSSPALIPVNTRPLAYHVLSNLNNLTSAQKYLVIDKEVKEEVETELHETILDTKTVILTVTDSNSVIETLRKALMKCNSSKETVVLLVTTIPTHLPDINEVVIDEKKTSNEEWSLIDVSTKNEINFIHKNISATSTGNAFTGYFRVKTKELILAVKNIGESNDLLDIIEYLNKSNSLKFSLTSWMDCGHESNFYKSKKNLINSRSFNSITVTENERLIKKSKHSEKLKQEVNYILELPESLASYYPRIFKQYTLENGEYAYEMSYYGLPNIAELMLYWNVSVNNWRNMFERFDIVLKLFQTQKSLFSRKQHSDFFFSKLVDRYSLFKTSLDMKESETFLNIRLIINGLQCKSFDELLKNIKQKIHSIYLESGFCIMHGDFCFNNMLYDIPNNNLKLIDARGSFSSDYFGIFGDHIYDLAKLMHSSVFGYDYLVNDLFKYDQKGNIVTLELNWRSNRKILEDLTNELILKHGYSVENTKFIVGLLFISMTPLHTESKNRQKAMFVHGLKILNEINYGD